MMLAALKKLLETGAPPLPSGIDCGQAWEDADALIAALDVQENDRVLSICSGGDSVLALLGAGARRVIAIDPNPAQIACLALRVAAYKELEYTEMLEMIGSNPSWRRRALYVRCRDQLEPEWRRYWDLRPEVLDLGLGDCGRFEAGFRAFRRRYRWLFFRRRMLRTMLCGGPRPQRLAFYEQRWDTWRWRLFCRLLFSRRVMERLGLEGAADDAVRAEVGERLIGRLRHALTELDPIENPYLCWILAGRHAVALPWALREENFEKIRRRLNRLEWHVISLEDYLDQEADCDGPPIDKFNLSDMFERMPEDDAGDLIELAVNRSRPGSRLAYWNFLKRRHRPDRMDYKLRPLEHLSQALHEQDKVFFYRGFVVEEVIHP